MQRPMDLILAQTTPDTHGPQYGTAVNVTGAPVTPEPEPQPAQAVTLVVPTLSFSVQFKWWPTSLDTTGHWCAAPLDPYVRDETHRGGWGLGQNTASRGWALLQSSAVTCVQNICLLPGLVACAGHVTHTSQQGAACEQQGVPQGQRRLFAQHLCRPLMLWMQKMDEINSLWEIVATVATT